MAEQEEEWAARRAGCIKLATRRQAEIVNASNCSRRGDLSSGQPCWHDPLARYAVSWVAAPDGASSGGVPSWPRGSRHRRCS